MVHDRMKLSPIFVIASVSLVALSIAALDYGMAFNSYNRFREGSNSPLLKEEAITPREQRFLKEVHESWVVLKTYEKNEGLVGLCELAEFDSTVEGLVQMLTHKVRPFSFTNSEQNLREVGRATGLSALDVDYSLDGKIYYKNGVAFMKFREDIVDYYENTEDGVRNIFYGRVDLAAEE